MAIETHANDVQTPEPCALRYTRTKVPSWIFHSRRVGSVDPLTHNAFFIAKQVTHPGWSNQCGAQ